MTVGELIAKLQEFPPGALVVAMAGTRSIDEVKAWAGRPGDGITVVNLD